VEQRSGRPAELGLVRPEGMGAWQVCVLLVNNGREKPSMS
jgi:hypothetical protein